MHEYVQKSTSTTLPRSISTVSGGEFSHCVAPDKDGAMRLSAEFVAPGLAASCAINRCSVSAVLKNENCARKRVSQPSAITTTPASTAAPKPRRSHSSAPRLRFIRLNTRPPARPGAPKAAPQPSPRAQAALHQVESPPARQQGDCQ